MCMNIKRTAKDVPFPFPSLSVCRVCVNRVVDGEVRQCVCMCLDAPFFSQNVNEGPVPLFRISLVNFAVYVSGILFVLLAFPVWSQRA